MQAPCQPLEVASGTNPSVIAPAAALKGGHQKRCSWQELPFSSALAPPFLPHPPPAPALMSREAVVGRGAAREAGGHPGRRTPGGWLFYPVPTVPPGSFRSFFTIFWGGQEEGYIGDDEGRAAAAARWAPPTASMARRGVSRGADGNGTGLPASPPSFPILNEGWGSRLPGVAGRGRRTAVPPGVVGWTR